MSPFAAPVFGDHCLRMFTVRPFIMRIHKPGITWVSDLQSLSDIQAQEPEVRALVLADQLCMCCLARQLAIVLIGQWNMQNLEIILFNRKIVASNGWFSISNCWFLNSFGGCALETCLCVIPHCWLMLHIKSLHNKGSTIMKSMKSDGL